MLELRIGAMGDEGPGVESHKFLADVGSRFLLSSASGIPAEIDRALARLVEVLDVDRRGLALFSHDQRSLPMAHSHARPGIEDPRGEHVAVPFPWWSEQLHQGRRVVFSCIADELPPEAKLERGACAATILPGDEVWTG
jgi:two-component system, NarL family, sensor kinase